MNHTPTLLEYFAAHEALADTYQAHADAMQPYAEILAGRPRPEGKIEVMEWDANWRAKLRFIRAKAMVDEAERIRASESTRQSGSLEKAQSYIAGFNTNSNSKTTGLSFSEALEAIKDGKKVKRAGADSEIVVTPYHGVYFSDILANDWEIVE